jgi:Ni2+-binding GTPase involved in maturation of urease and hydrogenase
MAKFKEYALRVNPRLEFITVSARTLEGFDLWLNWLNKSH